MLNLYHNVDDVSKAKLIEMLDSFKRERGRCEET
jgi:hypothetical protein